MSKSIKVIVSLVFVVFLALAATNIEAARYIEYPSLFKGNHALHCDGTNTKKCERKEANPYDRGCTVSQHCFRP